MKQDVLFVGIGQAGSNLAYEMKKKGYQTFYINSTNDDVDLLDISNNLKYHIPGATGCGRNRKKALEYTRDQFENIDNLINNKFPMFKHIYICFSTGGGTGSGISPVLLSILSQKYPNKNFGYVAIMPNSDESIDVKTNTLECCQQLQKLEYVKNNFYIDNNSSDDIIYINKVFAEKFDKFINVPANKSIQGNIDYDEIEKLITTKGNVVFVEYKDDKLNVIPIFATPEKNVEKAFFVNNKNPITSDIVSITFDKPIRIFKTYNNSIEHSYGGFFGLDIPKTRLLQIQEEVLIDNKEIQERLEERSDDAMSFIIPDNLKSENTKNISKIQEVDLTSIFDSFN